MFRLLFSFPIEFLLELINVDLMNIHHCPYRLLLTSKPNLAGPISNGGRGHNNGFVELNLDTNMVIILAALLCALIYALRLNSIVRCSLRCSQRFALDKTVAKLAVTELRKSMLWRISLVVYGCGVHVPMKDCPICLGEFLDGEKIKSTAKMSSWFPCQV